MQVEWLKFVMEKARKICAYENNPKTDEQYLACRAGLLRNIKKANEKLANTSDKKYLNEIKKLKKRLTYLVSQTEYEQCKKIIEEYKACYGKIIDEQLWTYKHLMRIYYALLVEGYESLEDAVADYKEGLKVEEELKRFMEQNGISDYNDPRVDEYYEKYLEKDEI